MMATTELHKIPDTILSRSQVFEFRTIPDAGRSPTQLRKIADAEQHRGARRGAGADRARGRGQHARRAERARPGDGVRRHRRSRVDDVSTVLGLVGRDLLFDLIDAVVAEDGPRAFALADRAVESGHDLQAGLPRAVARRPRHDDAVGRSRRAPATASWPRASASG